jgi:hypothetical protein
MLGVENDFDASLGGMSAYTDKISMQFFQSVDFLWR